MWWQTLLGVVGGLLLLYVVMLALLWRFRPADTTLRDALRLLPDLLRLIKALAADASLPRRLRIYLALLLVYLASPIDLVPDFIPVLGYADDAVIVAVALRAVVRSACPDKVRQAWPGSPGGLAIVLRLAGHSASPPPEGADTST
jgi:uncharacterized membrane protein YkvA (DUF1232 family)